MDLWEYKTIQIVASRAFNQGAIDLESFQNELNNLGVEGWELVSCFDTNMHEGTSRYVYAVFKRRSYTG